MDLGLQFSDIHSLLLHYFEHRLQGPFVADPHVILILVEDKLLTLLVDCVIGEVHADIIYVVFVWRNVGLCGESAQAFAEDKNTEGIDPCD